MDLVKELNLKLTKADLTTQLDKKVDTTKLNTELAKKVDTTKLNTELAKKVDTTKLTEELDKKVDTTKLTEELDKKVDTTKLTEELAKKVDTTTFTTDLAKKVDTTKLTEELDKKVDTTKLTTELAKKVDTTKLTEELGKKANQQSLTDLIETVERKADQSALDSKANITDIIPKSDLETMLDAKANKSELESVGSKEYVDNELGKKADKSEIEELRKQIENLQKDNRKLSKSIYVEAVLTTAIKPWTGVQSSYQFKNLKIEHNTDDLGKSDAKSFTFTAAKEQNYLIDASITLKFTKETSGVGLPTFIYKIQVFQGDKWQKSKFMQWQYNGVTQKPNKGSKDTSSIGTLKSTDIIHLKKDEKVQFILECKSLLVTSNEISIQLPTSFVICSLN